MDMEPTRPGIIIPTQGISGRAYDEHIPSLVIDGTPRRAHLMSRESGGMTSDLVVEYVEQCIDKCQIREQCWSSPKEVPFPRIALVTNKKRV